jgi:hypothetical protein
MTAPPPTGTLRGAFADLLRSDRAEFNARFATARSAAPALDPERFTQVLHDLVAPTVERCEATVPGSARRVGTELFDMALELAASGPLRPAVADAWRDLLPAAAPHLASAPRRMAGGLLNAAATLDAVPGARGGEWRARLRAALPLCPDGDTVLAAGQVAAWRAGMAGYRGTALEIARGLEAPVLAAVLGITGDDLARLAADPWLDPAAPGASPPVRVGAFRGLGGTFVRPPVLERALDPGTGAVVATDGEDRWLVVADAFGSVVVRAGAPSTVPADAGGTRGAARSDSDAPPAVAASGIEEPTSWVAVPGALAVTSALSHSVLFLPGVGP